MDGVYDSDSDSDQGQGNTGVHDLFLGYLQHTQDAQTDSWAATIQVNGRPTRFRLDTGADVTAVGPEVVGNAKLQPASRALVGPGGARVPVVGCVTVKLKCGRRTVAETLHVVKGQSVPLLSRRACSALRLV